MISMLLPDAFWKRQEFNYTEWQHRLWEGKPYQKLQA